MEVKRTAKIKEILMKMTEKKKYIYFRQNKTKTIKQMEQD